MESSIPSHPSLSLYWPKLHIMREGKRKKTIYIHKGNIISNFRIIETRLFSLVLFCLTCPILANFALSDLIRGKTKKIFYYYCFPHIVIRNVNKQTNKYIFLFCYLPSIVQKLTLFFSLISFVSFHWIEPTSLHHIKWWIVCDIRASKRPDFNVRYKFPFQVS